MKKKARTLMGRGEKSLLSDSGSELPLERRRRRRRKKSVKIIEGMGK